MCEVYIHLICEVDIHLCKWGSLIYIMGHFKCGVPVGVSVSDFKSGVGLMINAKQHQH